jgi:hypothetical protein
MYLILIANKNKQTNTKNTTPLVYWSEHTDPCRSTKDATIRRWESMNDEACWGRVGKLLTESISVELTAQLFPSTPGEAYMLTLCDSYDYCACTEHISLYTPVASNSLLHQIIALSTDETQVRKTARVCLQSMYACLCLYSYFQHQTRSIILCYNNAPFIFQNSIYCITLSLTSNYRAYFEMFGCRSANQETFCMETRARVSLL